MKDKKTILFSTFVIVFLVTFILIMIIIPKNKTFKHDKFRIKLPSYFVIKNEPSLDYYLYSKDVKIGLNIEDFNKIEDEVINKESTLQEYASRVSKLNKYNVSNLYKVKNTNYIYYSYYKNDFIYIALFTKTNNSFYTIYFASDKENKGKLFDNFNKWTKNIKIDENN